MSIPFSNCNAPSLLAPNSRCWLFGLVVALGAMLWSFSSDFAAPWTDQMDGNGACWSQSAHNTLRAGLRATAGVPSAFYFGTPPIPPEGFYTHHPPLLSLLLTAMFAVFGEAEWVARLLPIACSLIGVVLLWQLMRNCTNARTAAFAVLTFAAMPMELRYGRMVNFEAIDLVWMLGILIGWHGWEKAGEENALPRRNQDCWRWLVLLMAALSLWTAWLGYMFLLVILASPRMWRNRNRRLALQLLAILMASLALFFIHIKLARPDAWLDLRTALKYRMAHGGTSVPWSDWWNRISSLLLAHIQPGLWLTAVGGAILVWRSPQDSARRRLGWCAAQFFIMNALYVVLFRNASSIHDYASFYFTVPVAMMCGVALDALGQSLPRLSLPWRLCTGVAIAVFCGFFVLDGHRKAMALRHQFSILSEEGSEPGDLIPQLGKKMRDWFGAGNDVAIICNFLPNYGPQLYYYAQHDLLPFVFTADEWREMIADPANAPVGGVIWLQDPRAEEILASLPPGPRERITVRDIPFYFWRAE
jgi:hypothetical protein